MLEEGQHPTADQVSGRVASRINQKEKKEAEIDVVEGLAAKLGVDQEA
jgi:hypothetical protein